MGSVGTGGSTLNDAGNDSGQSGKDGQGRIGCESGLEGPRMVEIPTSQGSTYCMDSTEVTQGQYLRFLDASPAQDERYWPPICAKFRKIDFDPVQLTNDQGQGCNQDVYNPAQTPDAPVRCVDWCDAQAYCAWAGKRLCGKIGGGFVSDLDQAKNADASMWYRACTQGGTTPYALGNDDKIELCSLSTPKIQLGANSTCHGTVAPYDQIFDLEGAIVEWEDANPETNGPFAGGVFIHPQPGAHPGISSTGCDDASSMGVTDVDRSVGFRCCLD